MSISSRAGLSFLIVWIAAQVYDRRLGRPEVFCMKIRFLSPLIWLIALGGIALRTAQLIFFFDSSTGFLHDSGLLSGLVVVLVLAAVLIPALYMRRHELVASDPGHQFSCGIGAVLAAIGTVVATVADLRALLAAASPFSFLAILAADVMLLIPLAALAAGHLRGDPLFNGYTALGLLPILALAIRAVYLFAVYTPTNTSFVNLLNLSALALLIGFFCGVAYLATDHPAPPRLSLLLCGCAAAVCGLIASVPPLICVLMNQPCPSSADTAHLLATGALSVYALFFLPSFRVETPVYGRRFRQ